MGLFLEIIAYIGLTQLLIGKTDKVMVPVQTTKAMQTTSLQPNCLSEQFWLNIRFGSTFDRDR